MIPWKTKGAAETAREEAAAREEVMKRRAALASLAAHPGWAMFEAATLARAEEELKTAIGGSDTAVTQKALGKYAMAKDLLAWPGVSIAMLDQWLAGSK